EHAARAVAERDDLLAVLVDRDRGGLAEHDAPADHVDDRVGRAEVDRDLQACEARPGATRNFGNDTSSESRSNVTSTGSPTASRSGGHSTTFEIIRPPSS